MASYGTISNVPSTMFTPRWGRKGADWRGWNQWDLSPRPSDMHFLQIPVLAHLGFGREHNGVKGFFVAGPQVGIFLNDTELPSWTGTPGPRPNNVTMQYGKAVDNKFDYGIVVGGGLEVSTRGRLHFLAEARYYFALGDMFANSKKDPFGRSANSTIEVKISVLYDVIRTK